MGALDTAVRSGRAPYVGISSYSSQRTRQPASMLRDVGTPLLISQPSYSMFNRWIGRPAFGVPGNRPERRATGPIVRRAAEPAPRGTV
jgi:hypothetical protein